MVSLIIFFSRSKSHNMACIYVAKMIWSSGDCLIRTLSFFVNGILEYAGLAMHLVLDSSWLIRISFNFLQRPVNWQQTHSVDSLSACVEKSDQSTPSSCIADLRLPIANKTLTLLDVRANKSERSDYKASRLTFCINVNFWSRFTKLLLFQDFSEILIHPKRNSSNHL